MNLEQLKQHYKEFDQWILSLKGLAENEWQKPVSEGKWSIAAVVAHLLFWDRYSLEERFPFFKEGAELPSYPDFQGVNDRAREYADTAGKEQILDELIEIRQKFHEMLEGLEEENLNVSFKIGKHGISIGQYFEDFAYHDLHHQKQVDQALGRTLVK
ncbi:DinB family protein [Mesobacillus subterraneus]|uniref:DinB family protein n=1 Tax=Mesobacillus subterraneus TaxID=285983 RepID=A0A3R9EBL5_9BACI|nr:DinB family protein [Mesobacillus subterraneus]RSD28204.1 DinB family protein [Mesobacillus subterraneus]